MNLEERLFLKYLKNRPRNIMDKWTYGSLTCSPHEFFMEKMKVYSDWAIRNDYFCSRKEVKSMNMIDFTKTNDPTMVLDFGEQASCLPAINFTEEEKEIVRNNWYLIIPPFKEGAIRANRNRYISYEIEEIDEKEHMCIVVLNDYIYESGIWMFENMLVGKYQINANDPDGAIFNYSTDGYKFADLIKNNLDDGVKDLSEDDVLYFKQVAIPILKSKELEGDLDTILVHFVGFIMKSNIQLEKGKPKAQRSKGTKIKTVAGDVEKNPKPKIIRTLPNGLIIKSVKVPRPASPDTIRTYHIEAWRTRGHVRHYKTGKTVYVRESVHHRKCLQGKGETNIPQTIIKIS